MGTQGRVVRSYQSFRRLPRRSNPNAGKDYEEDIDGYDEMVIIKYTRIEDHCEHHIGLIIGKAHIAYLPRK